MCRMATKFFSLILFIAVAALIAVTINKVSLSEREQNAQDLTEQAILLYDTEGREQAFAKITAQQLSSADKGYPFVLDPRTGKRVAHGAYKDRVGTVSILAKTRNDEGVPLIESATAEGVWVEYVVLNPASGKDDPKRSFIKLHDGYVFGAGYYTPDKK